MKIRSKPIGWTLLCLGLIGLALPSLPASAAGETITVTAALIDGSAPFNADDLAGHDSGDSNGVVRTNDNLIYNIEALVADAPATNVTITMELAQGTELSALPPFCGGNSSITPAVLPEPVVPATATSWTALPRQTLVCNVGGRSANSTFTYPISVRVRPTVPNGTVLDTVTAGVTSDDVSLPSLSPGMSATVSARAQFDISINSTSLGESDGYISTTLQACTDGSGRACMRYRQAITISAPFGGKGSAPLDGPLTFSVDLGVDSLYPAGSSSDPDFSAAGADALATYGAAFSNCANLSWMSVGSRINGNNQTVVDSVRDSGTTTCTQPDGPGTPVYYSVAGLDSTAYTSPTMHSRPANSPVPGDAAYVYAAGLQWELPIEAVVDLGIGTPPANPTAWTLNWNTQLKDFAPTGIDGIPADPAANRLTNDYRVSSYAVASSGAWTSHYVGTPNATGNTPPEEFSSGWSVWEGPAGSTGMRSGEGQLYPGETTISATRLSIKTATTGADTSFLGCNSWDNTVLQLTADEYDPSSAARLQRIPSDGAAVWIHGYNTDGIYFSDPALVPTLTVQYGTGPAGAFGASTCDDADSPAGWYDDPALVPGNDPSLVADRVYTAVSRVRYHLVAPAPTTADGGPYVTIGVGLRAEPSLPAGVTLPTWVAGKMVFESRTMAEMLDPAAEPGWTTSSYVPADNSGARGDRLRTSRAIARLRKEVKDPATGSYGTTTPQYTGGQTAEFRITPTLTAGVNTPATVDTMIEDCLPAGVQFVSSNIAPSLVQPTAPADADLSCEPGESYVRWELGPQPINTVLPTIEYVVRLSVAITSGSKLNTARIVAEGDASSANERTATASIGLVQPAGVVLDKVALTPLVEVNRFGETVLDSISWRVDFANLETSPGPTDVDIIDVFPRDGYNGSSFGGTLTFDSVTVTQGDTPTQPIELLYTSAPIVNYDADHATNDEVTGTTVWCDGPSAGTPVLGAGTSCPVDLAAVTGIRVRRAGAFGPADIVSFEVQMTPATNSVGDMYINTAAGRGQGLALLTGPVAAPISIVGSSVGDTVFLDANLNGVQDAGEVGVEGIWVQLEGTDSDGNAVIPAAVQTNSDGHYSFGSLQSGTYEVTFDSGWLVAGQEFTFQDIGADDLADSDGDPITGIATVTLVPNSTNLSVDQGVIEPDPSVSLIKKIDGDDAQAAPGVGFAPGDSMEVTFEVTNTGNLPLGSIMVTDSHIDAANISCPPVTLAPGEMTTCTATYPAPAPGFQHTNTATVTATPGLTPAGTQWPEVSDTDIANAHVVPDPQITITKYVVPNGQATEMDDANDGEGLGITVNGLASWFYEVENPGNAELTIVSLFDNNGTPDQADDWQAEQVIVGGFNPGDTDQDTLLDPGEVWLFISPESRNLVVAEPIYTSDATVTATPTYPSPPTLTATDPAIHHGNPLSVSITKFVQTTEDANYAPGPFVTTASDVTWTYVVLNDGTVDLFNLVVTDDQIDDDTTIDCGLGDNMIPGPLIPDDSYTCSAAGTAVAGQYTNTGAVDGEGPTLPGPGGSTLTPTPVHAEDPANYFGASPAIEIIKYTQTIDADTPADQPLVDSDATVAWTYVVTNTGNTDLFNVTVTDDQIDNDSTIVCAPETSNVVPVLVAGDTVSCVVTGSAIVGQYQNTGTVTATGPETLVPNGGTTPGQPVTDDNPSHYFGINPQIDVVKTVQSFDANEAPGPRVAAGDIVRWDYIVTNLGNVALSAVVLNDDVEGSIACPKPSLLPGESMNCRFEGVAGLNAYLNNATAEGTGPTTLAVDGTTVPGAVVADDDPANHFAAQPNVSIIKLVNGADANAAPGLSIRPGADFDFTYEVINTGNVTLSDLVVTDDKNIVVTCPTDMLEPTMSMTCTGEGVAPLEGSYVNTGTVVGIGPDTVDVDGNEVPGGRVSDSDMAHAIVRDTFDTGDRPTTLAFTGTSSKAITYGGIVLMLAGLGLLLAGRRNARNAGT